MTHAKIAGPWEQDDRGGWKRVGVNGIPWAEVWPRGYAGYGWAAGGDEGLASDAVTSDGNLTAAKRAADAALTAVGCGLVAAWPVVGHAVRLPRPFEARAADFARDLQALTERYGVAVLQSEGIRYGDHVVALVDSAGGAYRFQQDAFDGETQSVIVWVDGGAK